LNAPNLLVGAAFSALLILRQCESLMLISEPLPDGANACRLPSSLADSGMESAMFAKLFAKLAAIPHRLLALSLPAKVALLLTMALVFCVVTVWAAFLRDPNLVPWRHSWTVWRLLAVLALVVAIPPVVYRALRLWLEGEDSRFADIDFAWKAGIEELERGGLSLQNIPVFLVLGSAGEVQERGLFNASRLSLRVREAPPGPAALHWYANPDAIFLVCSDAGLLSRLAALGEKATGASISTEQSPMFAQPLEPIPAALPVIPSRSHPEPIVPAAATNPRGTLMAGAYVGQQASALAQPAAGGAAIRGTMMASAFQPGVAAAASATVPSGRRPAEPAPLIEPMQNTAAPVIAMTRGSDDLAPAAESKPPIGIPPHIVVEQTERLEYVCRLLRRARDPLCAVNGVMAMLSFDVIRAGASEAIELQRAIRGDLSTLQRVLQIRCAVTALVVGMERERGFLELVRRVGPDRAAAQRFGKGFDLRVPPTPEELESLTAHACGAFEDWVYTLFREKGAISKPGNTRLYGLLCQVRRHLQTRLAEIVSGGFGHEPAQHGDADPILFSGCYFAATGAQEDRQAFVKAVLEKLPQEQESIQWTRRALADDRRHLAIGYLGLGVAGLAAVALAVMIFGQIM